MEANALHKLTYGLFLLTANEDNFDNGCIINTAIQVASTPERIAISVLKGNKTHDMILNTGTFNVSSITTSADFGLFKHFGMQSGREVNKFETFTDVARSENNLLYLTKASNMYLSAKVISHSDLDTHTLFIAELTDSKVLSEENSCTYEYYHNNIKPQPQATEKTSWVCTVCGYVYEGEEIPDDYECPWCHHPKSDFVKKQ